MSERDGSVAILQVIEVVLILRQISPGLTQARIRDQVDLKEMQDATDVQDSRPFLAVDGALGNARF